MLKNKKIYKPCYPLVYLIFHFFSFNIENMDCYVSFGSLLKIRDLNISISLKRFRIVH